ncbi:HAMP domain-containing protein [bacterium]|nr:HAMP domain-containing protein [bacterium]
MSFKRRVPIAIKIFFGFAMMLFFVLLGSFLFLSQLTKLNNIIKCTSTGMYRVALSQQLRGKLRQQRSSRVLFNHLGQPVDRATAEKSISQLNRNFASEISKAKKNNRDKSSLNSLEKQLFEFIETSQKAISLAEDSSAIDANTLISNEKNKKLISSLKSLLESAQKKSKFAISQNDLILTVETVDLYIKPLFYIERFKREKQDFLAGADSLAVLSTTNNRTPEIIKSLSFALDSLFEIEIYSSQSTSVEWDSVYAALNDTLENILINQLAGISTTLEQSQKAVVLTRKTGIWGTVILFLLGLIIAYAIASRIASPIGMLREATAAASRGEWDRKLEKTTDDEIGDLTDDFNAMLIKLGKLDEMKSRFLASITHDLKSPIGRVRGNIANLQDGLLGPVSEGQTELLDMMSKDIDKLSHLIHDILDLQKMKAGAFKLDIKPVSVHEFILSSLEQHAVVFVEKEIEMGIKIEFDNLTVNFDHRQIDRVLDNLITNALKFTSPGGKIIIEASQDNDNLVIKVYDTGVGIPKEHLDRVFGEFYQVEDKAKPAKGTGLGLAISKQIIEAHSGKIWVDSVSGEGTYFAFSIPISRTGANFG